ncbi:3530_t:CDS:2, partial [Funneliformis geosporum]
YQEVKKLLPDISDVNLRQQLYRARKLYKLFNAVGMKKIKQVTYNANAISNLNNTQIQNIINYVFSKAITDDHQNPKNNQQVNSSEATDSNKMECLYQYTIKHGLDPEKFSIVTEAEKKKGTVNSS